jgi:hypothetical protein
MKFGIFYELQLPRPWQEGDELKLYQDALTQLETADRLGYDHAWVVEHHFLEEYSIPKPEDNSMQNMTRSQACGGLLHIRRVKLAPGTAIKGDPAAMARKLLEASTQRPDLMR